MRSTRRPDAPMRHFSLALIGWALLAGMAWILLAPRSLFSLSPDLAEIVLGIGFAAALNTVIDAAQCCAKGWHPVHSLSARLAQPISLGGRTFALGAVLALALSRIATS